MTQTHRFRIQLLVFALVLLAAVTAPLFAQEDSVESPLARYYANNEFQLLCRRYIRWAEEAFNNSDFEACIEYSALARENADLSDAYVRKMMERDLAEKKILRAATRLTWAEKSTVSIQRPEAVTAADGESDPIIDENNESDASEEAVAFESPASVFAAAKEALAMARTAFGNEAFDSASMHAQAALDALAWITVAPPSLPTDQPWRIGDPGLPRYYVVRLWTETGDCFWNIAAKPFVYGDPWQWRILYNGNPEKLQIADNPNRLAPGTVLEIPARPGETRAGTYDSARK